MVRTLLLALMMGVGACGCMRAAEPVSPPSLDASATFRVPESDLPQPLVVVAYGDMRFTDPAEISATDPRARQALVARVASERPAAVFVNGDVPWHGVSADYAQYHSETSRWREQHLRVYPALGNHEFTACLEAECLARWWSEFPELRGRRWYSVALGQHVLAVALDSTASLLPHSEQRNWLETQLAALGPPLRCVFIILHHPPVADLQTVKMVDHNPRPNEQALADYLGELAGRTSTRFVVSAGHIHNYERLERDGIVYLVSGGGGARPVEIDRTPADLYRNNEFPNYHYVRFEFGPKTLVGEMIRFSGAAEAGPAQWQVRDRFELSLPP